MNNIIHSSKAVRKGGGRKLQILLSALDKYSELTFSNLKDFHSEVFPIRGFPFSFVSSYFPWLSFIVTPLKDFFLFE